MDGPAASNGAGAKEAAAPAAAPGAAGWSAPPGRAVAAEVGAKVEVAEGGGVVDGMGWEEDPAAAAVVLTSSPAAPQVEGDKASPTGAGDACSIGV